MRAAKQCATCGHRFDINGAAAGCIYILDTGQRRPCPSSEVRKGRCTAYVKSGKPFNHFVNNDVPWGQALPPRRLRRRGGDYE